MVGLERLLEGGPHRRYLYGYLSQLREDHPHWVVTVTGTPPDSEYLYIREGRGGARTTILPILIGRELLTIRALRQAMRDPSQ